jgi:hypothetical protein
VHFALATTGEAHKRPFSSSFTQPAEHQRTTTNRYVRVTGVFEALLIVHYDVQEQKEARFNTPQHASQMLNALCLI